MKTWTFRRPWAYDRRKKRRLIVLVEQEAPPPPDDGDDDEPPVVGGGGGGGGGGSGWTYRPRRPHDPIYDYLSLARAEDELLVLDLL